MKTTTITYKCDNCKKVLSKNGEGKSHLSINFNNYSGWVAKRDIDTRIFRSWQHTQRIKGIMQFCNGKCLGQYFDKLKKKEK